MIPWTHSFTAKKMTLLTMAEPLVEKENHPTTDKSCSFVRSNVKKEICKQVIRAKLRKQRHLVVKEGIDAAYLDSLFPQLLKLFDPQTVNYNGGIAKITNWKISCYLETMENGVPTADPNLELLDIYQPLLEQCNDLFLHWYRQQHACNDNEKQAKSCRRLMTFITRYTVQPGEQGENCQLSTPSLCNYLFYIRLLTLSFCCSSAQTH
jgi:hypothetical protein